MRLINIVRVQRVVFNRYEENILAVPFISDYQKFSVFANQAFTVSITSSLEENVRPIKLFSDEDRDDCRTEPDLVSKGGVRLI